jgi:transcriptional regulator with XRE-family HTH domain
VESEVLNMEENKEFGQYLKKLRKIKGITLTELGELVGYSNPYLSQIETGKRGTPSPEILKKLSEPLGVSYEELMVKAGYLSFEEWQNTPIPVEIYDLDDEQYAKAAERNNQKEKMYSSIYSSELNKQEEEWSHRQLEKFLQKPVASYKGHALTDSDRRLIAAFVEGLFAERLNKGE